MMRSNRKAKAMVRQLLEKPGPFRIEVQSEYPELSDWSICVHHPERETLVARKLCWDECLARVAAVITHPAEARRFGFRTGLELIQDDLRWTGILEYFGDKQNGRFR
jgi:hypothetical protein